MDKDLLKNILDTKRMSFTVKEINEILDAELAKAPSEMDSDIIEACLDILERDAVAKSTDAADRSTEKSGGIKKISGIRRALLIAAVIAMLFAIAVPVSAKYVQSDLINSIVQRYSDRLHVELKGSDSNANGQGEDDTFTLDVDELTKILNSNGIYDVVIPDAMLTYKYSTNVFIQHGDYVTNFTTRFIDCNSNTKGRFSIVSSKDPSFFDAGCFDIPKGYRDIQFLNVNGMDIVLTEFKTETDITYIINDARHSISFEETSFNNIINIANTIGK